jgi:hypothetical protein
VSLKNIKNFRILGNSFQIEPEADEVVVADHRKKIPPSQPNISLLIAYLLYTAESF